MARYTEGVCRLCRRERMKLFLKGPKCDTMKCPIERKPYPPGEHGRGRIRESEYMLQLREKQKARRIYGVLERQFRHFFTKASETRGVTGDVLLQMLERRLDNVVYRLGLAPSHMAGRQLVRHGHIQVNGRKVDIPSFQVKAGDEVKVRDKSKKLAMVLTTLESRKGQEPPEWLSLDTAALAGRVLSIPTRGSITVPINEQLIVEFYSK